MNAVKVLSRIETKRSNTKGNVSMAHKQPKPKIELEAQARIDLLQNRLTTLNDVVLELYLAAKAYIIAVRDDDAELGDTQALEKLQAAMDKLCPSQKIINDLRMQRKQIIDALHGMEVDSELIYAILQQVDNNIDKHVQADDEVATHIKHYDGTTGTSHVSKTK